MERQEMRDCRKREKKEGKHRKQPDSLKTNLCRMIRKNNLGRKKKQLPFP